MLLSQKAFELVTAPHGECGKPPCFPEIVFVECGTYKAYKDDKCFIIEFFETTFLHALIVYGFYEGQMSNFSAFKMEKTSCRDVFNLTPDQIRMNDTLNHVDYGCGEKCFKAACAVFHGDENLDVLEAVLNASEPKQAKVATLKLKNFNKDWDDYSRNAMVWTQMCKCRDPVYRDFLLKIAKIARDDGVKSEHCYFLEATPEIPAIPGIPATIDTPAVEAVEAVKADRIWGTGVGILPLYDLLIAEGNTTRLSQTLTNYKAAWVTPLYPGSNYLGLAIGDAFSILAGNKFECRFEEMWEFLNRVQEYDGFSFFTYEEVVELGKHARE